MSCLTLVLPSDSSIKLQLLNWSAMIDTDSYVDTYWMKPLLTAFFEYFHLTGPQTRFSIKDRELDTSYPLPERK